MDALVFVEEKNGGAGGVDELGDLVGAKVAVQAFDVYLLLVLEAVWD